MGIEEGQDKDQFESSTLFMVPCIFPHPQEGLARQHPHGFPTLNESRNGSTFGGGRPSYVRTIHSTNLGHLEGDNVHTDMSFLSRRGGSRISTCNASSHSVREACYDECQVSKSEIIGRRGITRVARDNHIGPLHHLLQH